MSAPIDDGGDAFPHPDGSFGMSLRDYFAGQALAGMCANPDLTSFLPAPMACAAYKIADAMLAARKEKP